MSYTNDKNSNKLNEQLRFLNCHRVSTVSVLELMMYNTRQLAVSIPNVSQVLPVCRVDWMTVTVHPGQTGQH